MKCSPVLYISVMALAVWLASCHKNTSTPPAPSPSKFTGCRISRIRVTGADTTASGSTYNFKYNDDGTVSRVSTFAAGDSFIKTFTYAPGYTVVFTADNNQPYSRDSIVFDSNKRIMLIDHYEYNGDPPPHLVWDAYQYDSSGNLVSIIYHSYSSVYSQNFAWANGDLLWNTRGTDFYRYVYDTGKFYTGNITARTDDLITYGRTIYTPRHLHSMAILDNTDTINCRYTVDIQGKLTSYSEIQPGNYISTTLVTYDCE